MHDKSEGNSHTFDNSEHIWKRQKHYQCPWNNREEYMKKYWRCQQLWDYIEDTWTLGKVLNVTVPTHPHLQHNSEDTNKR